MPSFFSGAPNDTPASDFSTTKAVIPRPGGRVGHGEHRVEVADAGVGDPALHAVEHQESPSRTARVFIAAASTRPRARTGSTRTSPRPRPTAEVPLLQLLRARQQQRQRAELVDRRDQRGRRAGAGDLLDHDHRGQRVCPGTVVRLRDVRRVEVGRPQRVVRGLRELGLPVHLRRVRRDLSRHTARTPRGLPRAPRAGRTAGTRSCRESYGGVTCGASAVRQLGWEVRGRDPPHLRDRDRISRCSARRRNGRAGPRRGRRRPRRRADREAAAGGGAVLRARLRGAAPQARGESAAVHHVVRRCGRVRRPLRLCRHAAQPRGRRRSPVRRRRDPSSGDARPAAQSGRRQVDGAGRDRRRAAGDPERGGQHRWPGHRAGLEPGVPPRGPRRRRHTAPGPPGLRGPFRPGRGDAA